MPYHAHAVLCFNYIETIPAPPIFAPYWASVSKVCINLIQNKNQKLLADWQSRYVTFYPAFAVYGNGEISIPAIYGNGEK
jgi:hypothetical protein